MLRLNSKSPRTMDAALVCLPCGSTEPIHDMTGREKEHIQLGRSMHRHATNSFLTQL